MAVLPCSESTTCLFRTRPLDASDALVFNEVFWVSMSYPALHQKTLRVDVCTTDQSHPEDCLVRAVPVRPSVRLSSGEWCTVFFREKDWRIGCGLSWASGQGPFHGRQHPQTSWGWGSPFHRRRSDRPESILYVARTSNMTSHVPWLSRAALRENIRTGAQIPPSPLEV